jgi:hypothetical protein
MSNPRCPTLSETKDALISAFKSKNRLSIIV